MYKKQKKSWVKHLDFLIIDIICLEVAFYLSLFIRLGSELYKVEEIWSYYSKLAILLLLIDVCVAFFMEAYSGILRRTKTKELRATVVFATAIFAIVILYIWATKQADIYSRQILLVFWGVSIVFSYICRCLWKRVIRYRMIHGKRFSQLIIITENWDAKECIRNFQTDRYKDFEVTGVVIVDKDRRGEEILGVPVIATADSCMEYIRTNVVDEVFINGNTRASSEALAEELLELGVTVHFNLVHSAVLRPNKIVEQCGKYMVLTSSMKIASNRQLMLKRATDIVGSLMGLLITGIAFLIFAPLIKKQSPGPIFYAQTRIGKNGRRFKFYKFRTMIVGADAMQEELKEQNEMEGNMFKIKDDPRVFPVGRLMRKYSIDELPQFWNVLKGDMSLVGTRPPTDEEFAQYELHHKARLGIRPGLTGMWQVSGRNDIQNFEDIVALDTYYISNWNLILDIKILLKTIKVVLKGSGAS